MKNRNLQNPRAHSLKESSHSKKIYSFFFPKKLSSSTGRTRKFYLRFRLPETSTGSHGQVVSKPNLPEASPETSFHRSGTFDAGCCRGSAPRRARHDGQHYVLGQAIFASIRLYASMQCFPDSRVLHLTSCGQSVSFRRVSADSHTIVN